MFIWVKRLWWVSVRKKCTWCGSPYRGACTHLSRKALKAMRKVGTDTSLTNRALPRKAIAMDPLEEKDINDQNCG